MNDSVYKAYFYLKMYRDCTDLHLYFETFSESNTPGPSLLRRGLDRPLPGPFSHPLS